MLYPMSGYNGFRFGWNCWCGRLDVSGKQLGVVERDGLYGGDCGCREGRTSPTVRIYVRCKLQVVCSRLLGSSRAVSQVCSRRLCPSFAVPLGVFFLRRPGGEAGVQPHQGPRAAGAVEGMVVLNDTVVQFSLPSIRTPADCFHAQGASARRGAVCLERTRLRL